MAEIPLVNSQLEEGEKFVLALDDTPLRPLSAFWFFFTESQEWRLIIASSYAESHGPNEAYKIAFSILYPESNPSIHSDPNSRFPSIDYKTLMITSPNHNIVSTLRHFFLRPAIPGWNRVSKMTLNQIYFDDCYIYRNIPEHELAQSK
jgi:hypothetical protein